MGSTYGGVRALVRLQRPREWVSIRLSDLALGARWTGALAIEHLFVYASGCRVDTNRIP